MTIMHSDIRGVLFDKDGTLLDFEATWMPAFRRIAELASDGDISLAAHLLAIGGFDAQKQSIKSGSLFASGNTELIAQIWKPLVAKEQQNGLARMIEDIFIIEGERYSCALFDVAALFTRLKANGIVIGIASSDSIRGIQTTLAGLKVLHLIDFSCGYDSGFGYKPDPGMVESFCDSTGVSARKTAVVGDNPHDLEMGRRAGVGLTLGVLSGNSSADELKPFANHILATAQEVTSLINLDNRVSPSNGESYEQYK